VTTSEILPTVLEGGYGTTSADREKVVSTLVIENVPFSVSGPDRFDACDRKRKRPTRHHARSISTTR
jgi:hypothetical protein